MSGGTELKHILQRIMSKLFSDSLLENYSFVGRGVNKKKKFSNLHICKVIIGKLLN